MSDGRTIRGVAHALVVLKITARYPDGRPQAATIVFDEQTVKIEDGDEFLTCYVPAAAVAKRSN